MNELIKNMYESTSHGFLYPSDYIWDMRKVTPSKADQKQATDKKHFEFLSA